MFINKEEFIRELKKEAEQCIEEKTDKQLTITTIAFLAASEINSQKCIQTKEEAFKHVTDIFPKLNNMLAKEIGNKLYSMLKNSQEINTTKKTRRHFKPLAVSTKISKKKTKFYKNAVSWFG